MPGRQPCLVNIPKYCDIFFGHRFCPPPKGTYTAPLGRGQLDDCLDSGKLNQGWTA